MFAHNLLDGFGTFVGVVEGDGADVVVENMGLDDSVEDVSTDEAKLAIDSGSGSTGEIPRTIFVMGETGVGVL